MIGVTKLNLLFSKIRTVKCLFTGSVFVAIYLLSVNFVFAQMNEKPIERLPAFRLLDLNGQSIDQTDLEGKVVVIDFWATWCAPCIKSFPAMMEAEKVYVQNEDVYFLYVNTLELADRDEGYIGEFLKEKGIDVRVFLDRSSQEERSLSDQLHITTLPQKLILDKSGYIRYRDAGFSGSDEQLVHDLKSKIDKLLNF
jgi:cytochrome c biogenesis protein CcmG/thiol:disulfide interchange protein DsbE